MGAYQIVAISEGGKSNKQIRRKKLAEDDLVWCLV